MSDNIKARLDRHRADVERLAATWAHLSSVDATADPGRALADLAEFCSDVAYVQADLAETINAMEDR